MTADGGNTFCFFKRIHTEVAERSEAGGLGARGGRASLFSCEGQRGLLMLGFYTKSWKEENSDVV